MTSDFLKYLKPKERRGSKPRCHILTDGKVELVAERLNALIQPWGSVDADDRWMPQGFTNTSEAQLGRVGDLVSPAIGQALLNWWLAVPSGARIPHWDIASTCTVGGKAGILLVEAKAHDQELIKEEAGKKRENNESISQLRNREKISHCMQVANRALSIATGLQWSLSLEHHYQMSNRFAWAWKLAELGIPVILVYLGFLNATEMSDRGLPFINQQAWEMLVLSHSKMLFPSVVWNHSWNINGSPFIPLIQSMEIPLQLIGTKNKLMFT